MTRFVRVAGKGLKAAVFSANCEALARVTGKGLSEGASKVESLKLKGKGAAVETGGCVAGFEDAFLNTECAEGTETEELAEERAIRVCCCLRIMRNGSRKIYVLSTTVLVPFERAVEKFLE